MEIIDTNKEPHCAQDDVCARFAASTSFRLLLFGFWCRWRYATMIHTTHQLGQTQSYYNLRRHEPNHVRCKSQDFLWKWYEHVKLSPLETFTTRERRSNTYGKWEISHSTVHQQFALWISRSALNTHIRKTICAACCDLVRIKRDAKHENIKP